MCARYSLIATAEELVEWFKLRKQLTLAPRYNIAPTQPVMVVRQDPDTSERAFELMRWGLIPSWAKDPSIGNKMINARSETAAEKPSFRTAMKRRRCLLPVSGYYEWKALDKRKQPYLIRPKEAPLMAFAGLWESWNSPEGDQVQSCTLLTQDARGAMRDIHDRMPVLLAPEHYDAWLDPAQQDGQGLLGRIGLIPDESLEAIPVSTHVNNPRHEGPGCIAPLRPEERPA
jgi:putative SOS response-associated peptidase YedK